MKTSQFLALQVVTICAPHINPTLAVILAAVYAACCLYLASKGQ